MADTPRIRVDWRASVSLLGDVLAGLAVPLLIPVVVALYYGESLAPFLVTIAVTLALGAVCRRLAGADGTLGPREAFLAV